MCCIFVSNGGLAGLSHLISIGINFHTGNEWWCFCVLSLSANHNTFLYTKPEDKTLFWNGTSRLLESSHQMGQKGSRWSQQRGSLTSYIRYFVNNLCYRFWVILSLCLMPVLLVNITDILFTFLLYQVKEEFDLPNQGGWSLFTGRNKQVEITPSKSRTITSYKIKLVYNFLCPFNHQ